MQERVLVTGPFGQIGSELMPQLQSKYGKDNVVALGHSFIPSDYDGQLEKGSVTDQKTIKDIIQKHKITQIYHLAAILSVPAEKDPNLCWKVNINGTKIILDLAVHHKIKVFVASSIAVFTSINPIQNSPQHTVIEPMTMYGVTKYSCELLCQYYHHKFGLDVRSLRYPGLISWITSPGGGVTDYKVAIFQQAILHKKYECYVKEDTRIPMMYIDDAIKATIDLMEAPCEKIKVRIGYNLSAVTFSVKQLYEEIRKHIPDMEILYNVDGRQKLADLYPKEVNDEEARKDWGWKHQYGLEKLTKVMIQNMRIKLKKE